MDLLIAIPSAVALLTGGVALGAFVNHWLSKSQNPTARAIVAREDTIFGPLEAEVTKDAPAIAEDVKTAIDNAVKAMEAAEQQAAQDVAAAATRQQAILAGNAQARATIQQAAAPVVGAAPAAAAPVSVPLA